MADHHGPAFRLSYWTGATLLSTAANTVGVALITSPVLFAAIRSDPQLAGYAFASVLGLGVFLGQKTVFEEMNDSSLDDLHWMAGTMISMLALLYYNVIVFIAAIVGFAGFSVFGPMGGILAIAIPIYDMAIVDRGIPFSLLGVVAIAISIGLATAHIVQETSWTEFRLDELVPRFFTGRGGRRSGGAHR